MGAKDVKELLVWQRARVLVNAVSSVLDLPRVRNDRVLRDQLNAAVISVLSNIAEGFSQSTDRAFARHLYIARGSTAEVRSQLVILLDRGVVSGDDFRRIEQSAEEIAKMLTGLIKHLLRENRKRRG